MTVAPDRNAVIPTAQARAERRIRQLIEVGTAVTLIGIATSVAGASEVGSVSTLAGLGLLVFSAHRLGRTGADSGASTRPRRKRRPAK